MKVSQSKLIQVAVFTAMLVVTFGCGGKNDPAPAPAPAPPPISTPPAPNTPGYPGASICPITNVGGTALMGNPYTSLVTSTYSYGMATQDRIILNLSTMSSNPYGGQRVGGTAGVTLSNLNQYQPSTQASFCGSAAFTQQSFFDVNTGAIQAVFQGANTYSTNPYYPAQQQTVSIYVGYDCPAYLLPAFGSTGSTIQGCFSVQIGNQPPIPFQATGRLY